MVRQTFIEAFTNLGLVAPAPVVELLSPVTQRALLARDDTLVGTVRFENGRQNGASSELKLLEVDAPMSLPPLCAFTRRIAAGLPEVVQIFLGELQRVAGQGNRPGLRSSRRAVSVDCSLEVCALFLRVWRAASPLQATNAQMLILTTIMTMVIIVVN